MLLEILDILQGAVMLILPLLFCGISIKFIFTLGKEQDIIKQFKKLFCLFLTLCVMFSVIVITTINIYQVGVIFEYEDAERYVVETIFLCVMFIWQMVGVVILFIIWKYIPNTKLISGDGNLKTRIKNKLIELKENVKKEKKNE